MNHTTQAKRAEALRQMHDRRNILLLPNAWDAGSARLFATRDFRAIATTSGGVAWALGYADGEQAPLDEILAVVRRIIRAVDLPVTVDFESGYGITPADVATSTRAVIEAGAAGINLEDGTPGHGPLRKVQDAAARIRAARDAATSSGVPLVINARVDNWMHAEKDPAAPLTDAITRARAYLAAGADCVYPIGLSDPKTIKAFVQAIDAPVNVMAGAGTAPLAELAKLGVARVSTATWFAALALGQVDHAARAVLETGRFDSLATDFNYMDAQRLFTAN
ncbi:MAG TPA: isocitrate lyase/phosphoenolpyruvate mutase family protein [Castellaniella sp.]|uniref:isocitrate lyase/PEP mutase family protein n=1 Tax=Castellaniella sp. TaxID=1955812 RepID=UPI002EF40DAF